MEWTPELSADVVKRFHGGETASEIAIRIGCSRNAVLGHLHRIGSHKTAKGKRPGSRPKAKTVQEYLDLPTDWPVKEKIRHQIVLMPNEEDIRQAVRNDPRACALRNAACRMFGVSNAAIGGRWAYIPQRDAEGKPYIARMQAPAATQRAIRQFDKTGNMPEGGFLFVPIAPSHRYEVKRAYMKKWAKEQKDGRKNQNDRRKHTKHRQTFRAMPKNFGIAS